MMKRLSIPGSACVMALVVSVGLLASPAAADPVTDAASKKIVAGKYAEAIADLGVAYKKNPTSSEYKKALAGAYFAQGQATMNDQALPPMRKYPSALASFRKAVELDPQHAEAKANIKMIEDIYTSMGRPIPQ
jgi:tetratricopeptide (TPR) repeat protein